MKYPKRSQYSGFTSGICENRLSWPPSQQTVLTTRRGSTRRLNQRVRDETVRMLIPPGRGAQLAPRPSPALEERNRNIHSIHELGRREWHNRSGYSKRSMVENTAYRYKTIIGRSMRSRTFAGQRVEDAGEQDPQYDDQSGDAR